MGIIFKGVLRDRKIIKSIKHEFKEHKTTDTGKSSEPNESSDYSIQNNQHIDLTKAELEMMREYLAQKDAYILATWDSNGSNSEKLKKTSANTVITSQDTNENDWQVIAKNIFSRRYSEKDGTGIGGVKRRLVVTHCKINGEAYLYILEDRLDHKYENMIHEDPNFDFQKYFESATTQDSIKEQLNILSIQDTNSSNTKEKNFSLEHINTQFFRDQLLIVDNDQSKAVTTPTPCIVYGGAGTGKTVTGIQALAFEAQINQGIKPIYIAENEKLVKETEKDYNTKHKLLSADFVTYEDLLKTEESLKKGKQRTLVYTDRIVTWIENYLSINKLNIPVKLILQEFRIICGYDEKDYLNLGKMQSNFGGEANREIRQKLWVAYQQLIAYLDFKNYMYAPFTPLTGCYPFFIVDEAQDFSLLQLKCLLLSTEYNNTRFLFDRNQTLSDNMLMKPEYLKQLQPMIKHKISEVSLKKQYRSAEKICEAANQIILIQNMTSEDHFQKNVVGNSGIQGSMQWVQEHEDAKAQIKKLIKSSPADFAVIALPEFITEAKSELNTDMVFTIEQIKGMQYKYIVLYRFFDSKNNKLLLKAANDHHNLAHVDLMNVTVTDDTEKRGTDKGAKSDSFWRTLYTAMLRGQHSVIVYQNFNHGFKKIYDIIRRQKNITRKVAEEELEIIPSTAEDCLTLAKKLVQNDNIDHARYIYGEYLAMNTKCIPSKEEVAKKFAEWIQVLNPTTLNQKNSMTGDINTPVEINATLTLAKENKKKKKKKKRKKDQTTVMTAAVTAKTTATTATTLTTVTSIIIPSNTELTPAASAIKNTKKSEVIADFTGEAMNLLNDFSEETLSKIFSKKLSEWLSIFNADIKYNHHEQSLLDHICSDDKTKKIFSNFCKHNSKFSENYMAILLTDKHRNDISNLLNDNMSVSYLNFIRMLKQYSVDINYTFFEKFKNDVINNIPKNNYNMVLLQASEMGSVLIVEELLERGADVNYADDKGKNALDFAFEKHNKKLSLLLISNKAVISNITESKVSDLLEAWVKDIARVLSYIKPSVEIKSSVSKPKKSINEYLINVINSPLSFKENLINMFIYYQNDINILIINLFERKITCNNKTQSFFDHLVSYKEMFEKFIQSLNDINPSTHESFAAAIFFHHRAQLVLNIKGLNKHTNLRMQLLEYIIKNKNCRIDAVQNIVSAIVDGNLDIIKYFVEDIKINVNQVIDNDHTSFLYLAAQHNQLEIVKYLINNHANVECKNPANSASALSIAADKGYIEVVKYLVEHANANINSSLNDGATALILASEKGHLNVVRYLIKDPNIDLSKVTQDGKTPLYYASSYGHFAIVQHLLEDAKIDGDKGMIDGETPLLTAATNGHFKIVKYLIEKGKVDVNKINNKGVSALMVAAAYGHFEIVKYLSEKAKINVNQYQSNGTTALYYAAAKGHFEIVKYLIEKVKVKIDPMSRGVSSLVGAAEKGHLNIVRYLIENAKVNPHLPKPGRSALLAAAQMGRLDTIKYLVEEGKVDINTSLSINATPLFLAAQNCHVDALNYLISKNAVINEINFENVNLIISDFNNKILRFTTEPTLKNLLQFKELNDDNRHLPPIAINCAMIVCLERAYKLIKINNNDSDASKLRVFIKCLYNDINKPFLEHVKQWKLIQHFQNNISSLLTPNTENAVTSISLFKKSEHNEMSASNIVEELINELASETAKYAIPMLPLADEKNMIQTKILSN